jgi:ribonuclease P protein component
MASLPVRLLPEAKERSCAAAAKGALASPSKMLPKKNRITRESFKRAAYGPMAHSGSFSLRISQGKEGPARFSFVISKKVAPSAVERNTLRRKGYAVLERLLPHLKPGTQGVFTAKKGAEIKTFAELERDITDLLAKIGGLERP